MQVHFGGSTSSFSFTSHDVSDEPDPVSSNPYTYKEMYVKNADAFKDAPDNMCSFLKDLDKEEENLQKRIRWAYIKHVETNGNAGAAFLCAVIGGCLGGGVGATIGFFGGAILSVATSEKKITAQNSRHLHPQPEPVHSRIERTKQKIGRIRQKLLDPNNTMNVQHLLSAEGYFNWVLTFYGHPRIS